MPSAAITGLFYEAANAAAGAVELRLVTAALPDVEVMAGELVGAEVSVGSRGVLVGIDDQGDLIGQPMEPLAVRDGALCFEPSRGGVPTRDNRLARGAHNEVVAEATRFGMVNAFVHATRAARHLNHLLGELGAPPLPGLPVYVSTHSGSRLPGFGHDDGDYRSGRRRPFSGGHYRVSQRTIGVPEPMAVTATGEIHLGPGRRVQQFAGKDNYLRAAAHNPATIYHEVGHHLCRHSADFRLNAERDPAEQRNGKIGVEEGVCDYLAASVLGTGRPYGWYRPERGERRDPETWRDLDESALDVASDDAHAAGVVWAALWWRCRQRLLEVGMLASGRDHDRAVVATLLALGEVGRDSPRLSRRRRETFRCAPDTVLGAYVDATFEVLGSAAAAQVGQLIDDMPGLTAVSEARAC